MWRGEVELRKLLKEYIRDRRKEKENLRNMRKKIIITEKNRKKKLKSGTLQIACRPWVMKNLREIDDSVRAAFSIDPHGVFDIFKRSFNSDEWLIKIQIVIRQSLRLRFVFLSFYFLSGMNLSKGRIGAKDWRGKRWVRKKCNKTT